MSGLSAEYILRKSLCRDAHCFSAHVPGKGYVNSGQETDSRADYDRQRIRRAESEIESLQWSHAYAEPGYTDPEKEIIFANWNVFPSKVTDLLERAGYAIEWSDEWATCGDCNKAVRTSPDSYGWTQQYYIFNDCELVCHECILADPTSYLDDLTDNPRRAVTLDIDPTDHGYTLVQTDFENGFHLGQTDDPKAIHARLEAEGYTGILFKIDSVGQFDVFFSVYARELPTKN